MSRRRVVVVGGGPAGMMAAGRAAECGADVVLLEKGPRLGRKLRISGKGRGNITNTADVAGFIEAFAPNGKFLYGAFSRFFRDDLLDLLARFGVQTKVERGGRVFPVSDRAADVVEALERWMASVGVRVKTNCRVRSIAEACGKVVGVDVYTGRTDADAVVLATGGVSYPKTGSTGDGYAMARELGHSVVPPEPALSALVTEEEWVKDLAGLSLRNVEASLWVMPRNASEELPHRTVPPRTVTYQEKNHCEAQPARKRIASEFGEMLFTHHGVSGPIVLTLSRTAHRYLKVGKVSLCIDLKPALSAEQLHARLIRDFAQTKHFANYLRTLLPKSMVGVFTRLVGIDPAKPLNVITAEERTAIVRLLKRLEVTVAAMGPVEEAIVTAGGVPIGEIDPKTMMSRLVRGLHFAGEIIDIDAETGGFNLQAAFSTGYVAGESAARSSDGSA